MYTAISHNHEKSARVRHDADLYPVLRGKAGDEAWNNVLPARISQKNTSGPAGTLLYSGEAEK